MSSICVMYRSTTSEKTRRHPSKVQRKKPAMMFKRIGPIALIGLSYALALPSDSSGAPTSASLDCVASYIGDGDCDLVNDSEVCGRCRMATKRDCGRSKGARTKNLVKTFRVHNNCLSHTSSDHCFVLLFFPAFVSIFLRVVSPKKECYHFVPVSRKQF